ncbi:hypothetical protein AA21291_0623 [Swaminathania salitolerans LMG 21291]|uniref:Uncharacterized protein n=1 Tax=Swaminathania salitolerans TaxID=182838 RepID=A0A511BPI2_9PROT|nr:hypothetical protein AA21291_0623 [Swaminathania salitolerans LMG 21291]GEL02231.1 hypothetical protein SSA02_13940 [Swaminathania salitolerans]
MARCRTGAEFSPGAARATGKNPCMARRLAARNAIGTARTPRRLTRCDTGKRAISGLVLPGLTTFGLPRFGLVLFGLILFGLMVWSRSD